MAEPIATLSMYDPDSGAREVDVFEGKDHPDPQLAAERMRAAVGDDFPNAVWAIGVNEPARDIMTNRRMREMGFEDYDHAEAQGRG